MLADPSFRQTLRHFGIDAPSTLTVPLTENCPTRCGRGSCGRCRRGVRGSASERRADGCVRPADVGCGASRGKALAALGVSALLVGAAGWAGLEVGRALHQPRTGPHDGRHPPGRRRDGQPRRRQPASVAEPDAGRGRWAGGVRRVAVDARRVAVSGLGIARNHAAVRQSRGSGECARRSAAGRDAAANASASAPSAVRTSRTAGDRDLVPCRLQLTAR